MYCGALEQLLVDNGCKTVAHMVENKGTCCTLMFGDAWGVYFAKYCCFFISYILTI